MRNAGNGIRGGFRINRKGRKDELPVAPPPNRGKLENMARPARIERATLGFGGQYSIP